MKFNESQMAEREHLRQLISNYEYISEGIYLDLEAFCFILSCCFYQDGVNKEELSPDNIYNFSLSVCCSTEEIAEYSQSRIARPNISKREGFERRKHVYTNDIMTQLHVTLLLYPHFLEAWIYNIGIILVKSSKAENHLYISPDKPTEYFEWVQQDWKFVYSFIYGLHNAYWDWVRNFEKKQAKKGGPSLLEAFGLSQLKDIEYDSVSRKLEKRNYLYSKTLNNINSLIDDETYIAAVSLQENFITDCIKNYLDAKSDVKYKENFNNLVRVMISTCKSNNLSKEKSLFEKVDSWRKKRNKVIHGGIQEYLASEDVDIPKKFEKDTANEGLVLCEEVVEWYYNEATLYYNPYRDEDASVN